MPMKYFNESKGSAGTTDWIIMPNRKAPYTLLVDFNGATATVDVEFSVEEDPNDNSVEPIKHSVLKDVTESSASDMKSPVSAFRLNVTAYTSGTVTLRVVV